VPVLRLPLLPAEAGKQHWGNLPGAALSLAIAEAASAAKRFTLLLTADSQSAERLEQELSFFAPDLPVLHFPDWETLPYDLFSPHQDIISQRIASLYRLPELAHGVLVVPITTALHRFADGLQLGLILGVDLGDLRLLGVGQLDAIERAVESSTTATRTALLRRCLWGGLGTGYRGAAGEEGDAERRDAENLHEGHLCRWMEPEEI